MLKIIFKKLLIVSAGLFASVTLAQQKIEINWVNTPNARLEKAASEWKAEAETGFRQSLNILVKESDSGDFTEGDLMNWPGANQYIKGKKIDWAKNKSSAAIVWKNQKNVGCIVHVPPESSLITNKEVLSYEWILWHELSHCIWPYRETKIKWWDAASGAGAEKLKELQEETWSDVWATLLTEKYSPIATSTLTKIW
jgi:hypothetical protein